MVLRDPWNSGALPPGTRQPPTGDYRLLAGKGPKIEVA